VATEKPENEARRTYLRRFSEGWSTFHQDPAEHLEPEAPDIATRPVRNAREAYVRKFANTWWGFHRGEDREDAYIAGIVVKALSVIAAGPIVWFVFDASRSTQWIGLTLITLIAAFVVFRGISRNRKESND
jgi:hypothetical protein